MTTIGIDLGGTKTMAVLVEDGRIETCPIAGTIRRGDTPLEDADRILELLNSTKDEAEWTDEDRENKAREDARESWQQQMFAAQQHVDELNDVVDLPTSSSTASGAAAATDHNRDITFSDDF